MKKSPLKKNNIQFKVMIKKVTKTMINSKQIKNVILG